jgi:hypothetical protein
VYWYKVTLPPWFLLSKKKRLIKKFEKKYGWRKISKNMYFTDKRLEARA